MAKVLDEIELRMLRNKIYEEVLEIFVTYREPTRLRLLGQRHGKRLRGVTLDSFIRGDERLEMLMVNTGGRIVIPKDAFVEHVNETAKMAEMDVLTVRRNLLKAFDVKLVW